MLSFLSPSAREGTLRAQNTLLRLQLIAVLRILRASLGAKAIPFTNAERRDIALAAKAIGCARRPRRCSSARWARCAGGSGISCSVGGAWRAEDRWDGRAPLAGSSVWPAPSPAAARPGVTRRSPACSG
jgi:hypothetical protein